MSETPVILQPQERVAAFNEELQSLIQKYGVTLVARLDSETVETKRGQEQRTVPMLMTILLENWKPQEPTQTKLSSKI